MQYDPQTGQGGIFVEYINTFLKLKTEASGYPSWVRTPEDEDRYIATIRASEGVLLDKDALKPNAASPNCLEFHVGQVDGEVRQDQGQDDLRYPRTVDF